MYGLTVRIPLVIRQFFSFQNNPKNLDLSYKMDLDLLDLWDCLGRIKLIAKFHRTDLVIFGYSRGGKTPSYSQMHTIPIVPLKF